MPTPVGSARACVAGDAARALDDAVAVARRRAHAQTTSLHVVSAILSPSFPSPLLRDALSRARSAAYSPRLQFKALELCFGVALDRLPAAHPPPQEPPVSNSLMAAIKRSQANQRRHPDTFYLYSGTSAGATTVAGVKVELQQMVLAILDDPVVSRVFGEAGFRSCDIKLAVLRPPPPILRFPRAARCPPLFLCNFDSSLPFPFTQSDSGDENCRRIGEILGKKGARNPVLIGAGAAVAARDFARAIERQSADIVPPELRGVKMVRIEEWNDGEVEETVRVVGLLVSLGDLKGLVEGGEMDGMVAKVKRVMEAGKEKVWVMGWSTTYEMYLKLLSKYPSLDKDWDLQLLPITSVKNGAGASLTRPHSLMESFVPFGGFFPLAYESNCTLISKYQSMPRCQICNEMYEQEVAALSKESSAPVEDQRQANLPAWLQSTEIDPLNKGLDGTKAKDDESLLNAKLVDLQKKWNDNCQRLHRGLQMHEMDNYQLGPHIVGLQYVPDKDGPGELSSKDPEISQKQRSISANSFPMAEVLEIRPVRPSISLPVVSESEKNLSDIQVRLSKSEQLQTEGFQSHQRVSDVCVPDYHASPSSVTSVTTDLILGTPPETPWKEAKLASHSQTEGLQELSGFLPAKKMDIFNRSIPEVIVQSHSSCSPDSSTKQMRTTSTDLSSYGKQNHSAPTMCRQHDPRDYKALFRSLIDKVGRQEEAIGALSQAILRCKSGSERLRGGRLKGDIWFCFHGPDKVGKRRVALALSESMFDGRENFISVDLSFQDGIVCPNSICDVQESEGCSVNFRGKTIADHIAAEVSKKPWSVVFLENVDEADLLVQNSLSQSIRTGKISDSHGREFSVNNAIFITTATARHSKTFFPPINECPKFSEERILAAQTWQMKILVQPFSEAFSRIRTTPNANVFITSRRESDAKEASSCSAFVSKRKLEDPNAHRQQQGSSGCLKRAHKSFNTFLDLNLPVEELVETDANPCSDDENHADLPDSWEEEFFELMDEIVNFKPFDFDALAESLLKEIAKRFHGTIGSESILEIDVKAMEQILAAAWILDDRNVLNHWIDQVLCRSLGEARRRRAAMASAVFRLVACQDEFMEQQAPGIRLPSRIVLN